ncbi:MAG: TIGR00730 family Rossman fold protein [Chlamydiia bacterium]|nr:TIGR00730 family Rossman fold protein [Chlamydiia bacterium]
MEAVTVFCGSRHGAEPAYADAARVLGVEIARRGWTLVYGGAHVGLMGIVADAALAAGGRVVGVIPGVLVDLEVAHRALTEIHIVDSMASRKLELLRRADAVVCLAGGLGTLDELFEALTLIQTKKVHPFPIYLMGSDYWVDMVDWLKKTVLAHGCISAEDLDLFHITDDPEEVAQGIERHFQRDRASRNF